MLKLWFIVVLVAASAPSKKPVPETNIMVDYGTRVILSTPPHPQHDLMLTPPISTTYPSLSECWKAINSHAVSVTGTTDGVSLTCSSMESVVLPNPKNLKAELEPPIMELPVANHKN